MPKKKIKDRYVHMLVRKLQQKSTCPKKQKNKKKRKVATKSLCSVSFEPPKFEQTQHFPHKQEATYCARATFASILGLGVSFPNKVHL